jgi:hypothetical protein
MVLIVERGPDAGRRWSIDKRTFSIGRDETCDVSLRDERASRRHARLWQEGDAWIVQDLHSHNGTWVNRQKLDAPHTLRPGDQVGLGQTVFSLQWESAPAPLPQRAVVIGPVNRVAGLADAVIALGALLLVAGAWLPWLRITFDMMGFPVEIVAYGRDGLGTYTLMGGLASLVLALGALAWRGARMLNKGPAGEHAPHPGLRWAVLGHLPIAAGLLSMIALDLIRYQQSAEREIILGINLNDLAEFAINWLDLEFIPQAGLILSASGLGLLLAGIVAGLLAALWKR